MDRLNLCCSIIFGVLSYMSLTFLVVPKIWDQKQLQGAWSISMFLVIAVGSALLKWVTVNADRMDEARLNELRINETNLNTTGNGGSSLEDEESGGLNRTSRQGNLATSRHRNARGSGTMIRRCSSFMLFATLGSIALFLFCSLNSIILVFALPQVKTGLGKSLAVQFLLYFIAAVSIVATALLVFRAHRSKIEFWKFKRHQRLEVGDYRQFGDGKKRSLLILPISPLLHYQSCHLHGR